MNRRGSALLIVLGMFAFMLVSAVSFSVYMRASRQPSSYVRRNVAARHLVKAAVARAIDEIDTAIGNDPFPGVGYNHDYGSNGINQGDRTKNDNWHGRVFCPSNEVPHADTVSTLTFEALGYIPSCLVNEVRYWSRHSRTAKWRSFNYGLGRYAFTAVNVSDFFELNDLIKGGFHQRLNRNSSPDGRVSLSYLFRSSEEGDLDSGSGMAAAFLKGMENGSAFGTVPSLAEVPLVSLMDFNLLLGSINVLGGLASPFYDMLDGSTGNRNFYDTVGADVARRQVFIAGGWDGTNSIAPATALDQKPINLDNPDQQPFDGFAPATTLNQAIDYPGKSRNFWNAMVNGSDNGPKLPEVSMLALLRDYTDENSVPMSLALPCQEVTPMVVGIELPTMPKFTVKFEKSDSEQPDATYYRDEVVTDAEGNQITYRFRRFGYYMAIDSGDQFEFGMTCAFPFVNVLDRMNSTSFTPYMTGDFFFTSITQDSGRRTAEKGWGATDADTWTRKENTFKDAAGKGMFAYSDKSDVIEVGEYSGNTSEALEQSHLGWMKGNGSKSFQMGKVEGRYLVGIYEKKFKVGEGNQEELVGEVQDSFKLLGSEPLDKPAFVSTFRYLDDSWGEQVTGTAEISPTVTVRCRLTGNDRDLGEKTVDLVPATVYDDKWLNNFDNDALWDEGIYEVCGQRQPLMRFDAVRNNGEPLKIDAATVQACGTHEFEWRQGGFVAGDPRFNYAPEDWRSVNPGVNVADEWMNGVRALRSSLGCDNSRRDPDIFLSNSDQGYLQSPCEFMFLPRINWWRKNGEQNNVTTWGYLSRIGAFDGKLRNSVNDLANANLMWTSYRPMCGDEYDSANGWRGMDNFEGLGIVTGSRGLRVNPYTDVTNIMLGAFANMPGDWWAASTNWNAIGKGYMDPNSKTLDVNNLFDWSRRYEESWHMADFFMRRFRDPSEGGDEIRDAHDPDDWKDSYEIIDWLNLQDFADDSVVDSIVRNEMTFNERKFFYGYLKECFANRSQLFLVFVRAESAAGGGGAGSGARAVALVWRDPKAPRYGFASGKGKDNAGKYLKVQNGLNEECWRLNNREYPPHKTRVLFYHQFD